MSHKKNKYTTIIDDNGEFHSEPVDSDSVEGQSPDIESHLDPVEPRSPDDALLSDIILSIIEEGRPHYSSELFVNETFSWSEPKKKNRTLGNSDLEFPKHTFVGRFDERHQFHGKDAVINFIKTLDHDVHGCDLPFCIRNKVQEKFPGQAIGVAGGLFEGQPGFVCNVIWEDAKTRVYFDPFESVEIKFAPKVIIV